MPRQRHVRYLVRTNRQYPEYGTPEGGKVFALGESTEQSKDRKALIDLMKKMLYGDAHIYKSDNLKAIADTFR